MIKRITEIWHRKRIRKIYKMIERLVDITYPISAGMVVAIIGTCSRYKRTGMTDVLTAMSLLLKNGKIVKEKGGGLLPDEFYEK